MISIILVLGAFRGDKRILPLIKICIIYALITTSFYNVQHNVHLILWLCNITAVLGLILSFRFSQKLYEVFFYFAWTGDLFTLLVWPNPVCPSLEIFPYSWVGFYLKHTAPLALTILLINQGNVLSKNAVWTALKFMACYSIFIAFYNLLFEQNILDFRYATLDFERLFGEWPLYVIVNLIIVAIWYYTVLSKIN